MRKYHLLIALTVFVLDRLTKRLVVQHIALYGAVQLVPGLFRLTHEENPGAAFSLFAESNSPYRTLLLISFSLTALIVVAVLLWKYSRTFSAISIALSLILSGTAGNLTDRLISGRVVDFLDFYAGAHHWPPFNVADSAIVAGGLLLLGRLLVAPRGQKTVT
jgi:signal peptidase II